jgi:hypothetical protein
VGSGDFRQAGSCDRKGSSALTLGSDEVSLTDSAQKVLADLESSHDPKERSVARRARDFRSILLSDCLHGEVVRKGHLPRSLRVQYGLENLYVEDLPGFWRLLYTVVKQNGVRRVVVVEIVDHSTYSKWFPGRGR